MKLIQNTEFGGERPLFAEHDIRLENVTIHAGESALKCCRNVEADHCVFEGKYPFWHVENFKVSNCTFTPGARAALWYSENLEMTDTDVQAPKMFREMDRLSLTNVDIPDAQETMWHCRNICLRNVKVAHADYIFMHCDNIRITDYHQDGNYSFQYCRNVEISNAVINSKDAFWNTENVTVRDSVDGIPAICILSTVASPVPSRCATATASCWRTALSTRIAISLSRIPTSVLLSAPL